MAMTLPSRMPYWVWAASMATACSLRSVWAAPELGLELVELLLLTVDLVDELGELLPGLVEVLLGVGQRAGRERRQHDDGERRHGGARPGTC